MNRIILVAGVILALTVNIASAQWFMAQFMETTEPLDSICGGTGHPLADGTPVLVYWDHNSDGPDSTDPLAPVCEYPPYCESGPTSDVNYNQFEVNASRVGFGPGYFYPESYFTCHMTGLNPPLYYLRICLPGRQLVSQVINVTTVPWEHEMDWTCVETECAGCLPPRNFSHFAATTACRAIDLAWSYPENMNHIDSVIIYRWHDRTPFRLDRRGSVASTVLSFRDTLEGSWDWSRLTRVYYIIKAIALCGDSQVVAFSGRVFTNPRSTPYSGEVQQICASNYLCDSVRVTWCRATMPGEDWSDEFVISRDSIEIGRVPALPAIRNYSFVDIPPSYNPSRYSVVGWSQSCGMVPNNSEAIGRALDCSEGTGSPLNVMPANTALLSSPNPFNSTTSLQYALPSSGHVILTVYDLAGRQVQTLVDQTLSAGAYRYAFDGSCLPSGVYFARLQGKGFSKTQKLMLLK